MSNRLRILIALTAVVVLGTLALFVVPLLRSPESMWVETCTHYRAKAVEANLMGRPTPPSVERDRTIPPTWTLRWAGVDVPVPAVQYDSVILDHGADDGLVELTLASENEVRVTLRWAPPEEDMLEQAPDLMGELMGKERARQAVRSSLGQHVQTRGAWMARHHTIDDVTCAQDAMERELGVLIAIAAYSSSVTFGEPDRELDVPAAASHGEKEPEIVGGTATLGPKRIRVELIPRDALVPPAVVTYSVPDAYRDIVHRLDATPEDAPDKPVWWDEVEALLVDPTPAEIDAALKAFNRSTVSPESRLGLAELERVIRGEKPWNAVSPKREIETRKANEVTF